MKGGKNHLWAPVVIALAAAALMLAIGSCFDTGHSCPSNLTTCGLLCPDIRTDRTNCGGGGGACHIGQDRFDGGGPCPPGSNPFTRHRPRPPPPPPDCGGADTCRGPHSPR